VGLDWDPLSLVSTTEELLERKYSGSGLESREYGPMGPSRWPRDTLNPQKLALTSPTSGGRSVGIVCSRTQATEFSFLSWRYSQINAATALLRGKSPLWTEFCLHFYEYPFWKETLVHYS
jgi:hypothetical protein